MNEPDRETQDRGRPTQIEVASIMPLVGRGGVPASIPFNIGCLQRVTDARNRMRRSVAACHAGNAALPERDAVGRPVCALSDTIAEGADLSIDGSGMIIERAFRQRRRSWL